LKCNLKRFYRAHERKYLFIKRYVGGAYGMSNEFDMMDEIAKNGPIVVSFEPDEGFVLYKNGIYAKGDFDNWFTMG
jgi:hypothetical protein